MNKRSLSKRFYVVSKKINEAADFLIENGFEELDSCFLQEEEELATHIFIDREKKTFYYTDEESLEQTNLILLEKHQEAYRSLTIKTLKKWAS